VERVVLAVREQVVVGMGDVRSSRFEGSKVLVVASMVFDDAMVVTKQRLAMHRDWALGHHC
jgi:hypothetical protein